MKSIDNILTVLGVAAMPDPMILGLAAKLDSK
jgi:hypothetical protein